MPPLLTIRFGRVMYIKQKTINELHTINHKSIFYIYVTYFVLGTETTPLTPKVELFATLFLFYALSINNCLRSGKVPASTYVLTFISNFYMSPSRFPVQYLPQ